MSADHPDGARGRRGAGGVRGLRGQLAVTSSSAAGAYGYTIGLGSSIAMAVDELRGPSPGEALLMMAGAVVAFMILELYARGGSPELRQPTADRPHYIFVNAHFLSAGAAICAAWAVVHSVPAPAAWGLVGFVVTALYFLIGAAQRIAIAGLQERRGERTRSNDVAP